MVNALDCKNNLHSYTSSMQSLWIHCIHPHSTQSCPSTVWCKTKAHSVRSLAESLRVTVIDVDGADNQVEDDVIDAADSMNGADGVNGAANKDFCLA